MTFALHDFSISIFQSIISIAYIFCSFSR